MTTGSETCNWALEGFSAQAPHQQADTSTPLARTYDGTPLRQTSRPPASRPHAPVVDVATHGSQGPRPRGRGRLAGLAPAHIAQVLPRLEQVGQALQGRRALPRRRGCAQRARVGAGLGILGLRRRHHRRGLEGRQGGVGAGLPGSEGRQPLCGPRQSRVHVPHIRLVPGEVKEGGGAGGSVRPTPWRPGEGALHASGRVGVCEACRVGGEASGAGGGMHCHNPSLPMGVGRGRGATNQMQTLPTWVACLFMPHGK